jgi:hypothetical protein
MLSKVSRRISVDREHRVYDLKSLKSLDKSKLL